MLGEKWKALSEKQRTPYEAKAAADKKRYEEEKAAYQVRITDSGDVLLTNRCDRPRTRKRRRRSPSKDSTHSSILSVLHASA